MFISWLEKKCYPNHPISLTAEEWVEWEKVEKSKPICNFCVNVVPQWCKKYITRPLSNAQYWFLYRFVKKHKYHLIDTGLLPGYYDVDTRIFHGVFNLMKEFCEDEQPRNDWMWESDKNSKKFVPGFNAAIESFKWQKELVYTSDDVWDIENQHLIGTPQPQALVAKELEEIYIWWVVTRPNREDPYKKFQDFYFENLLREKGSSMSLLCARSPEEEEKRALVVAQRDELEKQYKDEDENMLLRLIKIRHSLWT
jgi:hypothetical protein